MADGSGRAAWLWGPLLLVAVLVVVFQFAETGEPRGALSSALPAGPSPGGAAVFPLRDGDVRRAHDGFAPYPGYPPASFAAGPAPYPGYGACPPWAMYAWPPSFPRPGDRSGRYWGSGAAEWGPPIGEYGPDAQVDPYWWVARDEDDR